MTVIAMMLAACSLGGPGGLGTGPDAGAATLEDLAFIAGAWASEEDGESMREVWDRPRGDAMVGHFSIVAKGEAVLYELFAVESGEDGLVLRLRHFGRGLEPWASEAEGPLTMPLAEIGEGRAVFEDPQRAFPRRLVYTREGDSLRVELEPAPDAERRAITISFERAVD